MCDCQVTVHNELKRGKNPFWQDDTLFASKAKINVFEKNFEWRVSKGDTERRYFFKKH